MASATFRIAEKGLIVDSTLSDAAGMAQSLKDTSALDSIQGTVSDHIEGRASSSVIKRLDNEVKEMKVQKTEHKKQTVAALQDMQMKMAQMTSTQESLEKKLYGLKRENRVLEKEKVEMKSIIEALDMKQTEYEEMTRANGRLKRETADLKAKNKKMSIALIGFEDELTDSHFAIRELEDNLTDSEKKRNALRKELETLRSVRHGEMDKLKRKIAEQKKQLAGLNGRQQKLSSNNKTLAARNEKLEKNADELNRLEGTNANLIQQNQKVTETMHTLNSIIAQRQDELNAKNQREKQLESEVMKIRNVAERLKTENHGLIDEQKQFQHTICELRNKVQGMEIKALKPSEFMEWEWNQIHLWIMGLGTGEFKKYETVLQTALSKADLNGGDLREVTPLVLKYWGINDKKDRGVLMKAIESLAMEGSEGRL